MKRRTQKLIFYAIAAVFVSFLLTCSPFAAGGDYDESGGDRITYTDVEYSPDGGSVTIYLDGSAPVRSSRALGLKWAKLGHDFFEVAFYHPDSGTVARAAWETGHAAGVSGVRRDVNYIRAYDDGSLLANEGAAIIFVGKKSDKTLLGVGKLLLVNGLPGTYIGSNAKTVTFEVAALKAGVSEAPGFSSFKTNSKVATTSQTTNPNDYLDISVGATEIATPTIGRKVFPLFVLDKDIDEGLYMHGSYEIEVVGLTTDFEEHYRRGIYQKANIDVKYPALPEYRTPRYPSGDNDNKWETPGDSIIQQYVVDTTTNVRVQSNYGLNIPFTNPVLFEIGPSSSINEHKVFAFAFEIPVYPLTDYDNRSAGFSWYIRPGYDSYLYDLDDGDGGNGGSILIGTGTFMDSVNYSIYVQSPPNKTRYNGTGGATAYNFSLDGLTMYLRIGQNLSINAIDYDNPSPGYLYFVVEDPRGILPVRVIEKNDDLEPIFLAYGANGAMKVKIRYYGGPDFYFGNPAVPPFHLTGSPPLLQPNTGPGGYNGDLPHTGEFTIYYFPAAGGGGLDFTTAGGNRFIIRNWLDFNNFQNNVINNSAAYPDQTFILVFFNDFDLGALTLTRANPVFIIILAGTPDIIIGKTTTTDTVFTDNNVGNLYYFGVWPFDEILAIQGIAINSEPFYLNAGGSYVGCNTNTLTGPDTHGNNYFISGGVGTKTVNDMGITVINRNRFYQSPP